MYTLVLFLPLISAITSGCLGRWIGNIGSQLLSTSSVLISAIASWIAFYEVALCGSPCSIHFIPWIDSGMLSVSWGFLFDSLTVSMLVVITTISFLVHLYSIEYMKEDPHIPRFMSYLSLFTFLMLILVTADNFIQLFVGWEGVGLSSYLLINFWYTRLQANKAAMKAMIVNRIGDFGLSLAMFTLFYVYKTLDFSTVFAITPYIADSSISFLGFCVNPITLIAILLFIGSIGKSAQIGLHTWLPDAMEGPTPVSALIHAATMVTAGVFLILRCSPLFEFSPHALVFVTFIGSITAFFAATTGVVQNDLKRVIAYSTCSQLGYMIFACGISSYSVSMFHLMNHAFFKALLFLSAGAVIHAMNDEQDMRKMGGLIHLIPMTYSMMLIGSLSLMGFPFLTGFYSKDVILELSYSQFSLHGTFAFWLGTLSAFLTSFYSFRLLYLTFLSDPRSNLNSLQHAHESPLFMSIPLILLGFGSIFIGYLTKDMMIGLGSSFWGNSLFILPSHQSILDAEFLPYWIKLIPVLCSLMGASIAFLGYHIYIHLIYHWFLSYPLRKIYSFLSHKWYWDKIYNDWILQRSLDFGYNISFKLLDRGIVEMIGPFGIAQIIQTISSQLSRFHSGYLYHYAFMIFIGLTFLITLIQISNLYLIDSSFYLLFFIILLFLNTNFKFIK